MAAICLDIVTPASDSQTIQPFFPYSHLIDDSDLVGSRCLLGLWRPLVVFLQYFLEFTVDHELIAVLGSLLGSVLVSRGSNQAPSLVMLGDQFLRMVIEFFCVHHSRAQLVVLDDLIGLEGLLDVVFLVFDDSVLLSPMQKNDLLVSYLGIVEERLPGFCPTRRDPAKAKLLRDQASCCVTRRLLGHQEVRGPLVGKVDRVSKMVRLGSVETLSDLSVP
jgi:hypothetical protein